MKVLLPNFRIVSAALVMLSLSACASTIRSNVDTVEGEKLDTFSTYAWITEEPMINTDTSAPGVVNPVNDRRVRISIEQELERKGYVKVPKENADFAVAFALGARDRIQVRNSYDNLGYGYYNHRGRFSSRFNRFGFRRGLGLGGGYGGSTSVRTITEGTLAVDVFDAKERQAIWHGVASKRVPRDTNGHELIAEAVSSLLDQFPDRAVMEKMMSNQSTT